MKTQHRSLFVLLICGGLLAGAVLPARADGVVTYAADRTTVQEGERFTLSVNVDATPDLYGAQLSLIYDNTCLEVIEVRAGTAYPAGEATYVSSSFTNGGTAVENIQFYGTLVGSDLTLSAGSLVEVVFEAKPAASKVTTHISNGNVLPLILANREGQAIPATPPAPLTITILPSARVQGRVSLQAPTNTRLITASIANASYQASSRILSGQTFTLDVPPARDYTLTAAAACHLSARKDGVTSPSSDHQTTLLAGDLNADGRINIIDLSMIGIRFGTHGMSGCENLNGDSAGLVDILDLTMAAGNFGKMGPTSW